MTPEELRIEHQYRYSERLALLGFTDPTKRVPSWAHCRAIDEADAAIEALKKQEAEEQAN